MTTKPVRKPVSEEEWAGLPLTFHTDVMARLLGCNERYVQNHATELGGRLIARRWVFSKPNAAKLLGLDNEEA